MPASIWQVTLALMVDPIGQSLIQIPFAFQDCTIATGSEHWPSAVFHSCPPKREGWYTKPPLPLHYGGNCHSQTPSQRTDVFGAVVKFLLHSLCFTLILAGSYPTDEDPIQIPKGSLQLAYHNWRMESLLQLSKFADLLIPIQPPWLWQTVKHLLQLELTCTCYLALWWIPCNSTISLLGEVGWQAHWCVSFRCCSIIAAIQQTP